MAKPKDTRKNSKQKELIYSILHQDHEIHPTADWIYEQARKVIPDISLGTVYRNLKVLVKEGNIAEFNYGEGSSRYDGNPVQHSHFVCDRCGRIFNVEDPFQGTWEQAKDKFPFATTGYLLEFHGQCPCCQANQGMTCFELRNCSPNTFYDGACPQSQFKNCWESSCTCPRNLDCDKDCANCAGYKVAHS